MAVTEIGAFNGEYAWLGNPWPCPVPMPDGIIYPSSEHAFHAQKSGNMTERLAICRPDWREAKRMGRSLVIDVDWWNGVRKRVMHEVVLAKFWENPELADKLRATDGIQLTEGNGWHDYFWGVCYCGRCPQGRNYLGRILMSVRDIMLVP